MARRHIAGTALALSVMLIGCAGEQPGTPAAGGSGDLDLPAAWPLTGVVGETVERPALAIKVENTAMARPQTGLEDADIVWEEMVEGGLTRFNAVYHSQLPEAVGPIRSLRPMDVGIAAPLGGPQVVSGGQPLFVRQLRDAGVELISDGAGADGFYRSNARSAPHNLYGTPEAFVEQASSEGMPPEQFTFALGAEDASAASDGEPATGLRLTFPRTSPAWQWDDASATWQRDEDGVAAGSADGVRLAATNVVVMRVQVVDSAGRDQSGDPVPETVLTGDGEAVVASGGRTVTGTWRKAADDAPVELRDEDDDVIELAPGTTWVELVPSERGSVDVER